MIWSDEALPTKSFHFRGKRCSGGKHSQVLWTRLEASKALVEKMPIFVIGKSASPKCFVTSKHLRNLPCRYRSLKKAWMDGTFFEEWLHELDCKFGMQGRKVDRIISLPIQNFQDWKLSFYSFCNQIPLPVHTRWIRG